MTASVLLADDQALLRVGFRMVLESQDDLSVAGEAADGEEAVRLTAELDPDVVLMDVRMPGMDGIEATRRIVTSGSRSRVLVLTTFDLDEYAFAALRAGASGFLLKDVPPADLLTRHPRRRRRRCGRRAERHAAAARQLRPPPAAARARAVPSARRRSRA